MSRGSNGRFGRGNSYGKRFEPGQSGNPGGVRAEVFRLRERALEYADEALSQLATLMQTASEPRVRLAACLALLDRAGVSPLREPAGCGWEDEDTNREVARLADLTTRELAEEVRRLTEELVLLEEEPLDLSEVAADAIVQTTPRNPYDASGQD